MMVNHRVITMLTRHRGSVKEKTKECNPAPRQLLEVHSSFHGTRHAELRSLDYPIAFADDRSEREQKHFGSSAHRR
jgi:hypothetical protein